MKKLLTLALALVMMLASVSAMADYTGSAPVFDQPFTVSVLCANGGSLKMDFDAMTWWQEVLKKANVDLKMELIDSSVYSDVIQPRLAAAQDLGDIVMISGNEATLAQSETFIPLNDLIEKYGYNLKKFFEKYPNVRSALEMEDGSIYFIPYFYTTESNSRTLLLNTQYLAALGITKDDVKTLDDYYNYLVKVRDNDVNGNGDPNDEIPLFVSSGRIDLFAMYWGLDIANTKSYGIDENGQVYCGYITDAYKECLTFINKLYTEGLLYNEFLSANYDIQTAAFAENRIGSIMHFVSNATDYSKDINPDWDFYSDEPIMQIIALENTKGEPVVYGRSVIGQKYGITANCKNPEEVFKFVDYLYSEEVGIQTWYGTEGIDYTLADGKYVFEKTYFDNEYTDAQGYNFAGLPGYQYDYAAKQCTKIYEQTIAIAPYTWNPTRLSKNYTQDQQDVLSTYLTDLQTYFAENTTAFMIGTRSLDEWDSYVQGAKDMGVEQVIAVYQEAEK